MRTTRSGCATGGRNGELDGMAVVVQESGASIGAQEIRRSEGSLAPDGLISRRKLILWVGFRWITTMASVGKGKFATRRGKC
jgi:hypothetical protein